MKCGTQYSDAIYQYSLEHGTDIFAEYQNPNTTQERKNEILNWFFNLCREIGEVPRTILDDYTLQKSIVSFSNIKPSDVYRDGKYWFNTNGLSFLYQFFPEINDVRKESHPMSINDFFNNDHKLRRVLNSLLSRNSSDLSFYHMFVWCGAGVCYNFRPAVAKVLYEIYGGERCKVLDSSAGFGSRLLGAHFAKNVVEYLGIDPNTAEHCKDEIDFLCSRFDTSTKEKVLKMGSEDFTPENFPEYQNYFDLYFTSPPYFNTEIYSDDETQSHKKFPSFNLWIKGFYQSTINNACSALNKDGIFAINISEKYPNIKELTKLFLANNGWYLFKTDYYMIRNLSSANKRFDFIDDYGNLIPKKPEDGMNSEPIWLFKHYSRLYREGSIDLGTARKYKFRALMDNKEKGIDF